MKGEIIPKLISYAVMIDAARALESQNKQLPVANQTPEPADDEPGESVTASQPAQAFVLGATSTSNSPLTIFQDFFITAQSTYVDASLGQFKIPVSYEGYNSSSKLLFPERSTTSRAFGDRRDIGIRLAKTFEYFGYSAGIFNGTGQNALDNNNAKDLALRLEVYPIEGLLIGGVAYGSVGKREGGTTRSRFEGDLRYERGPFLFQGEYIWGHDNNGTIDQDGQGFSTALGWTFAEVLQPVVRLGILDRNLDEEDDSQLEFDAGINWYILKQEAKLQLTWFHFSNQGAPDENDVILCAQLWF